MQNWRSWSAGFLIAWLSLSRHAFSGYWIFAAVAAYAALAVWHERVLRAKSRAETAAAFYERGLARIEDRWAGTGQTGERFRDPKHDYADDLDLFGPASLFELLSTARLPMGENLLARWLRNRLPPARHCRPPEARRRTSRQSRTPRRPRRPRRRIACAHQSRCAAPLGRSQSCAAFRFLLSSRRRRRTFRTGPRHLHLFTAPRGILAAHLSSHRRKPDFWLAAPPRGAHRCRSRRQCRRPDSLLAASRAYRRRKVRLQSVCSNSSRRSPATTPARRKRCAGSPASSSGSTREKASSAAFST